jgi:hypothetical protein
MTMGECVFAVIMMLATIIGYAELVSTPVARWPLF